MILDRVLDQRFCLGVDICSSFVLQNQLVLIQKSPSHNLQLFFTLTQILTALINLEIQPTLGYKFVPNLELL